MARYISLGRHTREGAITVKEGAQRYAKAREYLKTLNVKVLDFYATLGPYDYVLISEAPNDPATVFKAAAFVNAFGAVSWTILPAMPYQDFITAIKDLPTP